MKPVLALLVAALAAHSAFAHSANTFMASVQPAAAVEGCVYATGKVEDAQVTAYLYQPFGLPTGNFSSNKFQPQGSATTDANGCFSMNIPANTAVLLVSSGGHFTDSASGAGITLGDDDMLRAFVPPATANASVTANLNLFTNVAALLTYHRAVEQVSTANATGSGWQGVLNATVVQENQNVAQALGIADLLTSPADSGGLMPAISALALQGLPGASGKANPVHPFSLLNAMSVDGAKGVMTGYEILDKPRTIGVQCWNAATGSTACADPSSTLYPTLVSLPAYGVVFDQAALDNRYMPVFSVDYASLTGGHSGSDWFFDADNPASQPSLARNQPQNQFNNTMGGFPSTIADWYNAAQFSSGVQTWGPRPPGQTGSGNSFPYMAAFTGSAPTGAQMDAGELMPPGLTPEETVKWRQARLLAVASRYLGLSYQHHHIPEWNPAPVPGWPWGMVGMGYQTFGVDCTNFTALIYDEALGISIPSGTPQQAANTSWTDNSSAPAQTRRYQVIPRSSGDTYASFTAKLQPGDIVYICSNSYTPGCAISHGILWIGANADAGGSPAAGNYHLDSHDNFPSTYDSNGRLIPAGAQIRPYLETSWYWTSTSHAVRIICSDGSWDCGGTAP